jgi:signal transduction histidine kinase
VAATRPGSGFGLYIARQLTRANHGDISFRPVTPHGACFVVTLPLGAGSEPVTGVEPATSSLQERRSTN